MLNDQELETIILKVTGELIQKDPIWIGAVDSVLSNRRVDAQENIAGSWVGNQIASVIDHTLLKPDANQPQIAQLCGEALQYQFFSVCVNPSNVPQCVGLLQGSSVKVSTVIGFPLGATFSQIKADETREAVMAGASEIDMVINVGALKSRNYDLVVDDIQAVVKVASSANAVVKVIIETCLLREEEKVAACVLAQLACADFVKTSTGFSGGGATVEDVRLMRRVVGEAMGVKAAGGIRSLDDAHRMLKAGASRLGTSSGVKIVTALPSSLSIKASYGKSY